jgi:hypothetical protein
MVDAKSPATTPDPPAAVVGRLAAVALFAVGVVSSMFVLLWFWVNTTPARSSEPQ